MARRLGLALITLWGISVVTFGLSRLAPGGPLEARLSEYYRQGISLSEEQQQNLKSLLGLDRSVVAQYVDWLGRFVTLDFGRSLTSMEPVRNRIGRAFGVSFVLQLCSALLIYLVAVPLGVMSAVRHGSWWDRGTTLGLFFLYSVPSFLMASLLIYALCSGNPFDWFPLYGWKSIDQAGLGWWGRLGDFLWHLVLPVICLSYASWASVSRYARTGMLEVLRQDYILAARAKGLSERKVLWSHALRNGLLPVVTLLAFLFPYLLGGSVIIENIFSIPGMGTLTFQAVHERDYPTVMALSVLVGAATLLGFLVTDLLHGILDPRLRGRS